MASRPTTPLATQNYLQHEDRTRLIRYARKIQDVVGETPRVVDPSTLPPPPSRRKLKRPKHSRAESLDTGSVTRPLLYIRVPESAPDRAPPTPAPSPTLTVFLNLTSSTDRDDTARRRKMAKLERTLGANVPTELVFPPEDFNTRRYRRLTARTVKAERAPSRAESLSRRQSSASRASGRKRRDADTDSISHGWVWVGKREEMPSDVRERERRQRARVDSGVPFDWGRFRDLPEHEDILPAEDSAGGMNRRESGWSGEWAGSSSVRNMDDVVRRLRGLKV
ncbi:hypothetical protein DFH06DRAFT_1289573 [Mycena polygramma]|nr:hypothetical protein DFH06DRAFT_1289573 [Mycena polygramma]